MIISKAYAQKLIELCKAEIVGTVTNDGKQCLVINRYDLQRTDHAAAEKQ